MNTIRLREFLRYGLVGIANTLVHAAVFFVLVNLGQAQSISNLAAFFVAVTFSFFMNAKFTFRQRPTLTKFLKMTLVMSFLSFGSGWLGDYLTINPIITFLVYCALSYILGFLLFRFFVFSK